MAASNFYKDLKALKLPIHKVFQQQHFSDLPQDWHVVISDVKNSTRAVSAGQHNDVNLAAACSLIAALNIAKEKGIEVPFFWRTASIYQLLTTRTGSRELNLWSPHKQGKRNDLLH
jgi:hypothetical protein